jgi:hypothetical protein
VATVAAEQRLVARRRHAATAAMRLWAATAADGRLLRDRCQLVVRLCAAVCSPPPTCSGNVRGEERLWQAH